MLRQFATGKSTGFSLKKAIALPADGVESLRVFFNTWT